MLASDCHAFDDDVRVAYGLAVAADCCKMGRMEVPRQSSMYSELIINAKML